MLRDLVVGGTVGPTWEHQEWVSLMDGLLVVNQTPEAHREIARLLGRIEGIR